MTLGEFKEKVKSLPDDYNLILSIYSNIDGTDFVDEVDVMGVSYRVTNGGEIVIKN